MCAVTKFEELLAANLVDPHAPAWDALYAEVCRPGLSSADEALLLPSLAHLASRFAPADRDNVLIIGGQVAAGLTEASWHRHAGALTAMQRLIWDWLPTPTDPHSFVVRLQAAMALGGDMLWGAELDRIVYDEVEVGCPRCASRVSVLFGAGRCFAAHPDDVARPQAPRTPLLPAAPAELDGAGRRMYAMCAQAGQQSVAAALTYLFGGATCTRCGTTFRVSDQIHRR